ncbi:hypothetical protein PENSPDRAFT_693355 [Peniophora sp. CONT]|nr:hypothetical protein PENSPDRAFT_693355 [Peniophora sp. CONT]
MKYRILVFPLYRAWFDPQMHLVAEVVPFIHQLLEGLVFLHNANIAHGDIKALSILMDPCSMYPDGFNPLVIGKAIRDYPLQDPEPMRTRLDAKPRYVYIDFGFSLMLEGIEGRRQVPYTGAGTYRPPETMFAPGVDGVRQDSLGQHYDPFSADVWLLGKLFRDLDFGDAIAPIQPLLATMCLKDATSRPTAQQSFDEFCRIVNTLSWGLLARVPNPMVTIYMNPDTRAGCFMGPAGVEDARDYLRRIIEFLVLSDCVPRISFGCVDYGRDSSD